LEKWGDERGAGICENNMKSDFRGICCEDMGWTALDKNRKQ
jgi:hypothetical protein